MMRFVTIVSVSILVIAAVLFANVWFYIETPNSSQTTAQSLVVARGESLGKISQRLHDQGVITNVPFFKAYAIFLGVESKVRAGEYVFPANSSPGDVIDLLLKGDFSAKKVTIPEGWTMKDIARYLANLKLVNADRFLLLCTDINFIHSLGIAESSLEGYLFPDTYDFHQPKNEEEVIRRMVGRFQEIYNKDFDQRAKQVGMNMREVVTLASIVEKETGKKDERPLIASVFLNRLRINMPLATDPTVIYGISNFNGNLTRQHLNTPGPYNTYINVGLPPTPIASPGAESIRAVLYPAMSQYLYFVAKGDGYHYFSTNESEHLDAVRKYQIERPRQRAETAPTNSNSF